MKYISNLHPSLKFTSEKETDGSLPFLDVFLRRTFNSLQISVYRKPTFVGQYIPWHRAAIIGVCVNLEVVIAIVS